MAFTVSNAVPQVDGRRLKVVGLQAPSGDAHTTTATLTWVTSFSQTLNLVSTPTDWGITLVTGADGQVAQQYTITAWSTNAAGQCTGFTIRKNSAAAGAVNQVLLLWVRCSRGVARG